MKQFIVFAGDCYYPSGGASDFIKDFDELVDAKAHQCQHTDWSHILDIHTGEVHDTNSAGDWIVVPIGEWRV